MPVNGYIFAGGKSIRMGRDKATLLFLGKPLAERAVDRMKLVASRVFICGAQPELCEFAPLLADPIEAAGPLSPLVAALENASLRGPDTLAVVLAVDLPLMPWQMLDWLLKRARVSGAWATIPVVEERPQPLCAVYRAALAPSLRAQLMAGERKLMRAVESACATPAQLDLFDMAPVMPEPRKEALQAWFLNVNTPEDVTAAEEAVADRRVW